MGNIIISESYVNVTEGYRFGDTDPYETYTDDIGELFKDLQRQYGRCVSKVYTDRDGAIAIGWVFQKKMQYTDTGEDYIQETWIKIHEKMPETVYHYRSI